MDLPRSLRFAPVLPLVGLLSVGCILGPTDELQSEETDGETNNSGNGSGSGNGSDSIPDNSYCGDVADWPDQSREFEEDLLVIVNEERAAGASCGGVAYPPVLALRMNGALRCAARVHSADMVARSFFDHDNPDGESPFDRMGRAGYSYRAAAENIAAGQQTPQDVMDSWMDSPGHCTNIMGGEFTQFGAGYVFSSDDAYGAYWTQTFGAPG